MCFFFSFTDTNSRLQDRERSNLVVQLTEQNQRLTSELQASALREQELASRISQLRDQVTDKRQGYVYWVGHYDICIPGVEHLKIL